MMQYDAKMDIMDTTDSSWFEFFIDPVQATKMLADPKMKKKLPKLCIQFTEKGFMAEKEKDKTKLAVEELNLFERKSASMRLCAMAAFAALDWDIDYIIDNISRYELLTLRVLADHFYKIYNEKNLDATFGNWLFYRFVLSIDRRNRLPVAAPKATIPTVYGQITATDMSWVRHDKVQRMINELREHVAKARLFITELSDEPRDVQAPGIDCFLQPFAKLAPKALHAALIGDRDVLVEIPSCDFEIDKIILPAADVANKCKSELVSFLFTMGEFKDAKAVLSKVVKPTSPAPVLAIDEKAFRAYSMMLNVNGPFIPTGEKLGIREAPFEEKTLTDENSRFAKSEYIRDRAMNVTNLQLKDLIQAENTARNLFNCQPESIRENINTRAKLQRFVQAFARQMVKIEKKSERKIAIDGFLQFLCATVSDLHPMLKSIGFNVTNIREMAKASHVIPVQPLPTSQMIDAITSSNDPFWRIVTKFSLKSLREALRDIGSFWFPNTMPHSEFMSSILTGNPSAPGYQLQRLLLSKLEQLSSIKHLEAFRTRLQEYFGEMSASSEWAMTATFESIHVQAAAGNYQCILPYERKLISDINTEQASLIFTPEFKPTENKSKMINQCLAFMLNMGEQKAVLEKGAQISLDQFPCVPIARLFGAYLINFNDDNMTKKCSEGFWQALTAKLTGTHNKRKNEATSSIDPRKEITLMFHLLELIREEKLCEFILGYAVALHNRIMVNQQKPNKRIHARMAHLFGSDTTSLEGNYTEDVRQLLRMATEKIYAIKRTDPDAIRSYADYLFFEKDFQGAGEKYMEFFASYSPNLKTPTSNRAVYDDNVLHRLRICLAHCGYLTLSLLTCQYMKDSKQSEYVKAHALLRCNETRDVGANCAEFVSDVDAIEILSSVFQQRQMYKSVTTLYQGASSLAANKNIPIILVQQEVNRRARKFLTTLSALFFKT